MELPRGVANVVDRSKCDMRPVLIDHYKTLEDGYIPIKAAINNNYD